MTTHKELTEALRARCRDAVVADKVKILDEFVAFTGYHRKHAIRVLREEVTPREVRERDRLYDEAVRHALMVLWAAADRVCGKRLKALIPTLVDPMERHGHLDLEPIEPTSCKSARRPSIECWPMHVHTSTGSASVVRAWAPRSGAAFRCAHSPTGEIRH